MESLKTLHKTKRINIGGKFNGRRNETTGDISYKDASPLNGISTIGRKIETRTKIEPINPK